MSTISEALARGIEMHKRGELVRAEPIYRQILNDEPENAAALHMLGLVALQTSRIDEAVTLLERSVAAEPSSVDSLSNLAAAYRTAGRPADALAVCDSAIRLDPDRPSLYYNRALALADLGRPQEAAVSYRRCLALDDNYVHALCNLGELERELGALDDALSHLDKALAIDPNYVKARYNRSLVLLSLGRLSEGFAEYEWRLRASEFGPRNFQQPKWDGAPADDKTLLVYAEQGWGDTLQFVRYLPRVARRCRRVIFEVPQVMHPLLAQAGFENLVPQGSALPPFDMQVALLSLPHVFGTTLETTPAEIPYLKADEGRIDFWRRALAAYDGFKVGIVWQGRPTYIGDRYRSIALSCFSPLAEVAGVRLFSLQKGLGVEQIAAIEGAFDVVDLGSRIDCEAGDFRETAAVIKNLDLVVSCDTACVHLAGALDVPVWVALPFSPAWRWLAGRTDSPWYPGARLFRQATFGDWPGLFGSMARALRQQIHAESG